MKTRYFLTTDGFELTQAIQEKVDEKVEHIEKFLKSNSEITIFLSGNNKSLFNVKMILSYQGHTLIAHNKGDDLYRELTSAKSQLIRQIKDLKNKKIDRRHSA